MANFSARPEGLALAEALAGALAEALAGALAEALAGALGTALADVGGYRPHTGRKSRSAVR